MKSLRFVLFCIPSLISAVLFHPGDEFVKNVSVYAYRTPGKPCDDADLVKRIITAYQLAEKKHLGNSMWQMFYDQRFYKIHEVFQRGNFSEATKILRNPGTTDHFFGIDALCKSYLSTHLTNNELVNMATMCLDSLVRVGEAIGTIKISNEGDPVHRKWYANGVLAAIENKLGIPINFPNPYPDEVGIYTSKGTASYRAVQALYQAYLIKELLQGIPKPRVLEIGAGLGRTAYYCKLFGIEDYTIIDIPITVLASSYFLGRTLGQDQVVLLGENLSGSENKVKIFTPEQFLLDTSQYDLIINVDSLTEMDVSVIKTYLDKIQESCPLFLSINHESNKYSVFELLSTSQNIKKMQRRLYWMRLGYAEELYIFDNQK